MHAEAAEFARGLLVDAKGPVLEVGSRYVNGSARELAPPGLEWVGVDLRAGRGVDLVVDACAEAGLTLYAEHWPPAATLACMETLEHTSDPEALLRNLWRCGEPGALLVLTTAGDRRLPHSGIDGLQLRRSEPYQNFTAAQLGDLLESAGFVQVKLQIGRDGLDLYASARA